MLVKIILVNLFVCAAGFASEVEQRLSELEARVTFLESGKVPPNGCISRLDAYTIPESTGPLRLNAHTKEWERSNLVMLDAYQVQVLKTLTSANGTAIVVGRFRMPGDSNDCRTRFFFKDELVFVGP